MLITFALTFFEACGPSPRSRMMETLNDVESFINERPDSALAVLEGVDSAALNTRALRARFSLLRTMAQAKNYLDLTVPGLIDEAAAWYDRHGSADERMKTLYYQGCIAQAKKDLNRAAVFYTRAEAFADKAEDRHAVGLLYEAIASIYNSVYNIDKEEEYIKKELAILEQTQDSMYGSALGGLALVCHSNKEWSKADSLYRVAIEYSENYPNAKSIYLSNYARMKLQQPEIDPAGAIELLDNKRGLSNGGLTPQEAGAYAYALLWVGDKDASDSLRKRLETLTGRARYDVLPWLRRMAVYSGNYQLAYSYYAEAYDEEYAIISDIMSDSVSMNLRDYFEKSAQQEKARRLRHGIEALALMVLLLSFAVILLFRERQIRAERDRLLVIRAELEQDIQKQESKTAQLSDDLSTRLTQLRLQLQEERLERLRKSGRYGYWIWMDQNGRSSDADVIKTLRKDIREICALEKDYHALENRLNKDLDNIVVHLKTDLGIVGRPNEEKFLCFWLIDLKPDMIAELLGISINNVYVKSHRLEERIRKLEKPEYSSLIAEKLT